MITSDDIRGFATALPEVEEFTHFRIGLPGFKVRGKPFAGMDKGETTAVFCVGREEAAAAVAAAPSVYAEAWRPNRTFLGLRVELAEISCERVAELVEHAWRNKAPKRLVAAYDAGEPPARSTGPTMDGPPSR